MVFSVEAARTAAELPALPELAELPDSPDVLESPKPAGLPAPSDVDEVRRIMWEHVGLQRSTAGLNRALADLAALEAGLPPGFSPDLAETRSLITVGSLIAAAALARPESLGCHWRSET
jgi:aspartate oxidase